MPTGVTAMEKGSDSSNEEFEPSKLDKNHSLEGEEGYLEDTMDLEFEGDEDELEKMFDNEFDMFDQETDDMLSDIEASVDEIDDWED